jgi:long-subunit fatty acid transport protein
VRLRVKGAVTVLVLFASLSPAIARAGNGDGVLLGNEAAMTGGAVAAVIHDGSGTWYNPAGLGAVDRDAVDVNGSALQLRAAEEGGLISSTTGESNDGGYLELISIPSAATIARRLEPGVTLAFGIFASRFSQHTTRTRLDAAAGINSARWTLSAAEFRATYHAGGAIGFRVDDHLRFGVSLFGVYRELSDTFQTAGAFTLVDRTRLLARGGIRQIRSFGAELGVGMQWEPNEHIAIGFTARSPGLEAFTQLRSTTTTIDATITGTGPDELTFTPEDGEIFAPGFAVLTAGRFNLAIAHRFDRGWVAAEIDVQPPLDIDPLLTRRFVWNARLGARYQVDDQLGLGAGFFTDHSEGTPIRELGETRVDFYGLSAGFDFRTPHNLGEGESAQTLVFATTAAVRYAVGIGEVGGLRFDPANGVQRATVPVDTTIHEVSLHIGSALYF